MSDFKTKMHQIQFQLVLRPRPRWGAYSAPSDPLTGFKGPTCKGRGEERREWRKGGALCTFFLRIYTHEESQPAVKTYRRHRFVSELAAPANKDNRLVSRT